MAGVKITGIDEAILQIHQRAAKAVRGASHQMANEAEAIANLAREMAPVDEHDLEEAIKVRAVPKQRDNLGRFVKSYFEVYVDAMHITADNTQFVGEYGYVAHEMIAPAGPYKLGPESIKKQAGNPGVQVGGKFLERAGAEVERGIENRILSFVRRTIL